MELHHVVRKQDQHGAIRRIRLPPAAVRTRPADRAETAATAQQIIAGAVERLPYERTCECASALKYALVTRPEMVPDQVKKDLAPIIGRYIS